MDRSNDKFKEWVEFLENGINWIVRNRRREVDIRSD